jgi:urease accessory protein
MISHGSVFCDAAFFAHSHRAACDGDDQVLTAIAELAAAFIGSKERLLETAAFRSRAPPGPRRRSTGR